MVRPTDSTVSAPARVASGAGFCLLLLLAWALASADGVLPETVLPGPAATARAAWQLITEQDFVYDVAITVTRVVGGVLLGALLAVPLGVAMGASSWLAALLQDFFRASQYPAAAALVPLLVLWLGVGELQKLAVIFLGAFLQLVPRVADALRGTRRELVDAARMLGVGAGGASGGVLGSVLLPAAAPVIANSLRSVLAWSWGLAIVAELVGSMRGIGHMIGAAQAQGASGPIVAGIAAIGLVRFVSDELFRLLNRQLFPWTTGETAWPRRGLMVPHA